MAEHEHNACVHCLLQKLAEAAKAMPCEAYHDKLMRDMERFFDRSNFLEELGKRVEQLEKITAGQASQGKEERTGGAPS